MRSVSAPRTGRPHALRLLFAPRMVLLELFWSGHQFGSLFGFLALEYLLLYPQHVATLALRLHFSPGMALSGLWLGYVAFALPIGVAVLGGAWLASHLVRWRIRIHLPVWSLASVFAYAWVAHLLWIAASIVVAFFLGEHPLLPHARTPTPTPNTLVAILKACIEFAPPVGVALWATQLCARTPIPKSIDDGGHQRLRSTAGGLALAVLIAAFALSTAGVAQNWPAVRPLMPGDPLPAFAVQPLSTGPSWRSADARGRPVLIDFWATWCPACVGMLPHLEQFHRDFAPDRANVMLVNSGYDTPETIRAFLTQGHFQLPVYWDNGAVDRLFQVPSLPMTIIADAQGIIRQIHFGQTEPTVLRRELEALIADSPPPQ